ncbi:hypothetical protein SAMD00023353_2200120 [Rosellinia necatrix]|uniref:Uncharacterized protein n=1 Tax=Rosellinia necatrix TaxID=77044 RepID=A0A1S7UNQ9_ROSNE|nr:hypothetical protein SAMD00023353_2200120 [Rosellinia necatrix]
MEAANTAVGWLSFVVTAVGLGGLITQASAINDQLDPFHATRTAEYLGVWFRRQQAFPWWRIAKPPPRGPVLAAGMATGFCGAPAVHVARIPFAAPGKAGWSLLLAMLHTRMPAAGGMEDLSRRSGDDDGERRRGSAEKDVVVKREAAAGSGGLVVEEEEEEGDEMDGAERGGAKGRRSDDLAVDWEFLPHAPLTRQGSDACIRISRVVLLTVLVMTNARPVFQFSEATGFRAGYASYCGQWYITWPIGQEAIIKFAAHDSIGKTEVLPRSFVQRVDRCGQMVCGVVSVANSDFAVAFCGRKSPGTYQLEHSPKGFQGAHGGRHLYNMLGGRAYEVDYIFARRVASDDPEDGLVLDLPSTEKEGRVRMVVPQHEEGIIQHALDCLPWTSLSWSLHRGLRDILKTYAKPVMDAYREELAEIMRQTVAKNANVLRVRGWDAQFIQNNMAHMAASAILAGEGNSGDSVRVVTDIVATMTDGWDISRFDEVNFWRRKDRLPGEKLDLPAIVALTKVFVLEWSQEFDYQIYHHLPITLYFA